MKVLSRTTYYCYGAKLLANDQEKLLRLLEESGLELFSLLTRLTLREDVAQDLMQELFLKLHTARGFDKAQNGFAYAWRVAMNLAFDWRKAQGRNPQASLPVDEQILPGTNTVSPLGQLVQAEDVERVLNAMGQLKPLSREVLIRRYIEQESYEEIAESLGKRAHSLRDLSSKGLTQLRTILKQTSIRPDCREMQSRKEYYNAR